jgi:hypothetical protein
MIRIEVKRKRGKATLTAGIVGALVILILALVIGWSRAQTRETKLREPAVSAPVGVSAPTQPWLPPMRSGVKRNGEARGDPPLDPRVRSSPVWLVQAIAPKTLTRDEIRTNEWPLGGSHSFNPRHLRVLQDIIDINDLDESSARYDYDNGDGILEPLELGFQAWVGDQLVALSLGPDPYWSFGYGIRLLPPSIADLDRLEYLDLQSNHLAELPYEFGFLPELREFRAQRNQLAELPDSFGLLVNLRGALLSDNTLVELPESIGDLPSLERLYVNDNPLVRLPDSIGYLAALRILGIEGASSAADSGNAAGDDGTRGLFVLPATLESLATLDTLYVTGNHLGCQDGAYTATLLAGQSNPHVYGLSAQRCSP